MSVELLTRDPELTKFGLAEVAGLAALDGAEVTIDDSLTTSVNDGLQSSLVDGFSSYAQ
jgi:hypothetical protein